MANTEVGSAYVTIYPQTDGNFSKQVGKTMGDSIGSGLSAKAVAIGNIISDVAMNAASAIGSQLSAAFENYANYEQLVGGVDTLFKESSQVVQQNAQRAFETAGMSANQYMEQVTSFSASLLQSLGGDTEAAARYADTAMRDMSDNANKMGTSMESITDAYQGFAKQNYTMLDNLKLGYGGTKSEMERLLADASKIAGVQFNIDSYSDVIQAIHVMQESMGIAGTTAEEAKNTISGSLNMLGASLANFTTELGKDSADIPARAGELVDSIVAVVENIAPRLLTFAENLFAALPTLYEKLAPYIQQFIDMAAQFIEEHQDEIQAASTQLFDGIKAALKEAIKMAIQALGEFIKEVIVTFPEWFPELLKAAGELFLAILEGLVSGIDPFMRQLEDMINGALGAIGGAIDSFIQGGADIIGGIVKGISDGLDGVRGVFDDVLYAMTHPIETAKETIDGIIEAIENAFSWIDISFPSFELPHIEVDWWDTGFGISIPSFYVDWYAKGGFADTATLTGNGTGYGEKGLELYWPSYGPYFDMYAKGIAEHMPSSGGVDIHDCTFIVRKESDIRAVAVELNTLVNRQLAGGRA